MAADDTGTWKPSQPEHPSDKIIREFPECITTSLKAEDDLVHVVRELHKVGLTARWKKIGQTLKVSSDVLDSLSGDSNVCLLYVVYNWLSGQTRLPDRDRPSWWRVVWVVADKLGGYKPTSAREIAKKCKEEVLGGQCNFVPSTTHAKDTPNTSVLECAAYRGDDAQESIDNAIDGLMGDLSSVATRWMQIGVFLGVEFSFLEERVHSKDLQQNLSDTLTNWLESSSSPSGNVTLQRLVEAIEHTGGGNKPRLAATIKAKLTSSEPDALPAHLGGGDPSTPAPIKRGKKHSLEREGKDSSSTSCSASPVPAKKLKLSDHHHQTPDHPPRTIGGERSTEQASASSQSDTRQDIGDMEATERCLVPTISPDPDPEQADQQVHKELFISYGHEEKVNQFVTKLQADLEKRGFTVWRDKREITSGSDWRATIGTGVSGCRAIIPILTKRYIDSDNCRSELSIAQEEKKAIFPIKFEDVNFEERKSGPGVRLVITTLQYIKYFGGVDYDDVLSQLLQGLSKQGGDYLPSALPFACLLLLARSSLSPFLRYHVVTIRTVSRTRMGVQLRISLISTAEASNGAYAISTTSPRIGPSPSVPEPSPNSASTSEPSVPED